MPLLRGKGKRTGEIVLRKTTPMPLPRNPTHNQSSGIRVVKVR